MLRRLHRRAWALLVAALPVIRLAVIWLPGSALLAESPLRTVRPLLERYCHRCHGPREQEADLRFDDLGEDLSRKEDVAVWQAILDQLEPGTMPPERARQPDPEERSAAVGTLRAALDEAYAQHRRAGARRELRRLDRYELRSTLRDLLHLDGDADYDPLLVTKLEDRSGNGVTRWNSDDPTREFPAEAIGFDEAGDRPAMSDFLLEKIIAAAEQSLERATHFEEPPDRSPRRYTSPMRTDGPGPGLQRYSRELEPGYDGIYQRYREPGAAAGGLGRVSSNDLARSGVGQTGRYRITVEASAHNQRHPWGELVESRQEEPLLLGLHVADAKRGGLGENHTSRQVAQWTMPSDGSQRTLTFDGWLDADWFPWVGWENGPYDRGLRPSKLVERFLPDAHVPPPAADAPEEEKRAYEPAMARALFEAGYQGPHLRIWSLTIEPLDGSWPPRSHVELYGDDDDVPVADLILRFARRAFRRPVALDEVARHVRLVEDQRLAGHTRAEALRAGYTAIIASPRFSYLQESDGPLDDHELAARLSYFLWSSMPDEELFALADAGEIRKGDVLLRQVDRMLAAPRAAAFFRRFPGRWLGIDALGSMPPPGGFYYHREMEPEMREQVDAFFAHLVRANRPVREIIDSDYTFLNERVAQWIYQRDHVWGDAFREVPARPPHGGGLLTMPAVMTATANGVDTSPIVRGVWVLRSVLGTPPSPPPSAVEPLSPDLRGATTIREQLALHREQPACNKCHREIDPLGIPFESFDELGKWRTHYRTASGRREIDPSSTLAGGRAVDDISGLRRALLEREGEIARHLTGRLLAYACGRPLDPFDRGEVDAIVAELGRRAGGLRDLIELVVESDAFRSR